MLARIQECILYRGFSNGEILDDMTELINLYEADEEALKAREDQFSKVSTGWWSWQECTVFRKYLAYISYLPSGKS